MPRIEVIQGADGVEYASFDCPACGYGHGPIIARPPGSVGPTWGWNGDVDRPTFTPSLLVTGTVPITNDEQARIMRGEPVTPKPLVCHSFVREGRIQFLSDCTHALAGQTVDLPSIED